MSPYLFEALSGEFAPICDPSGTTHTLGRLAIASYEKGGEVKQQEVSPHRYTDSPSAVRVVSHGPSWAKRFESRIVYRPTLHGDILVGIGLQNLESEAKLRFTAERQEDGLTVLRSSAQRKPLPLRLGSDIKEASEFVADIAKSFFDQVA